jgi:hypothetical protein
MKLVSVWFTAEEKALLHKLAKPENTNQQARQQQP